MTAKSQVRIILSYYRLSEDANHYICQCKKRNDIFNEELCLAKIRAKGVSEKKMPTPTSAKTSNLKRHIQRFHPQLFMSLFGVKIEHCLLTEPYTSEENSITSPSHHSTIEQNMDKSLEAPQQVKEEKFFPCPETDVHQQTNGESAVASLETSVPQASIDGAPVYLPSIEQKMNSYLQVDQLLTNKIVISMTKEKFENSIVDMVVDSQIPVSFFSSPAFLELSGETASKLDVPLHRDAINMLISSTTRQKKEETKAALKNNHMYLKLDIFIRQKITCFVIYARYINDIDTPVSKILSVTSIDTNPTSEYVSHLIDKVLKDFEIQREKVLCIVTDNATNVLNMNETLVNVDDNNILIESSAERSNQECILESILDDDTEKAIAYLHMDHMHCIAYSMERAICSALKLDAINKLLTRFQQLVSRTSEIGAILKNCSDTGTIRDPQSHWGNTYLMVKQLLDLRPYIEQLRNPNISLSDYDWNEITELEMLLRYLYTTAKKLQSLDLSPGDALFLWKEMIFKLERNGGLLEGCLASSLKKQECRFLDENPLFLAGIFIDPMNRVLLSHDQKLKGKDALYRIAHCLGGSNHQKENKYNIIPTSFNADEEDFYEYLDKLDNPNSTKNDLYTKSSYDEFKHVFFAELQEAEKYNRSTKMKLEDVYTFYPTMISQVAKVAAALPTTQVSIGKLISIFRSAPSRFRASVKDEVTEAILFLAMHNDRL